jgi:hypothetical protein
LRHHDTAAMPPALAVLLLMVHNKAWSGSSSKWT